MRLTVTAAAIELTQQLEQCSSVQEASAKLVSEMESFTGCPFVAVGLCRHPNGRCVTESIYGSTQLNRNSVWLEKLEGGIEHLKEVVINDSLSIADELEQEMQSLVLAYQCEWKQAIEDESFKKRFKHYVNSDEKDENLVFVPMREQTMPKQWV